MSRPDAPQDQAHGLRLATPPRPPVRVIAITGGKGGVGKTTVATNLSVALAQAGSRTLLLDADLGLANVDVLLGLNVRYTLADVIEGRCMLADTVVDGPGGLHVVPAASGRRQMAELLPAQHVGLVRAFDDLELPLDNLVIDTAAGLSDSVLTFCQAAHEVIVVVCNEPASITDAYAQIKVLSRERNIGRIHVLANMVRSNAEGRELFEKLTRVTGRFLDVVLDYMGAIPQDDWLRRAIQRQQAVVDAFPSATSALALRDAARRVQQWQAPSGNNGGVEFFVERMVRTAGAVA